MLSIIIATLDSERVLVPTLAALVPGATAGLVSEVLIADGGSRDGTATVADVAGCNFMAVEGPPARRLGAAATAARASWLLFLRPQAVLDAPWPAEAGRFMAQSARADRAAVFRRGAPAQPTLREVLSLLPATLGVRPRPDAGLLISKRFYEAVGGHSERAADPQTDLVRRIGRRRLVTLSTAVLS